MPHMFDRDQIFTPIGPTGKMFVREVGKYIWQNIALDKYTWTNVSEAERNALNEHMSVNHENFDMEQVKIDIETRKLKGGVDGVILKRYRDQKTNAKKPFSRNGRI